MQDSTAIAVGLRYIDGWRHYDWDGTKNLISSGVPTSVTNTQPSFAGTAEFSAVDAHMVRRARFSQLVEKGSVQVFSSFIDDNNALVLVTF